MYDLLSFIHSQIQEEITAEISGEYVSVIFDGTTHPGEAFAVVLHYTCDGSIRQRLKLIME